MTGNPFRLYDFLGVNLAVSGSEPLLEAMQARLRYFSDAEGETPDLRFEFVSPADSDTQVTWPVGEGREVTPALGKGFRTEYCRATDRLYVTYQDRVRAFCDVANACVRIHYPAGTNLWIVTHPMFVTSLFEIMKRRGYFNLHAAGVCVDGKALLLAGYSMSGKSTLTVALCRAGFGFMSDDCVFLTQGPDGLKVLGFPEEIDLLDETAAMFPELEQVLAVAKRPGLSKRQIRVEEHWEVPVVPECSPTLLVFPQVAGTATSAIQLMDPQEAIAELVSNLQYTHLPSTQAHLDALGDLVRRCACYRLWTGRDLDVLPQRLRELVEDFPGS